MRREPWLQLLSAVFVGGGLVSLVSGCEAAPVTEERRLVQHKLLTPDPVMRVKASPETRDAYGIDEWRFYRGRGALFATGYSAKGKALRGLSTKIARGADGSISHLELDVNNGSKVGILTRLASATTASNANLDVPSQAFLRRAVLDFARVGVASDLRLRSTLNPTRADVCGAAVPNVFTSLANCVRNANQNASRVAACLRAAELAEQTRTNCRGMASPLGNVIDPLSGLGVGSSQLLQLCGGDAACARDMTLLQSEEIFGQQCNGNLGCLTEDFGFGPFGGTGGVTGSTGSTGSRVGGGGLDGTGGTFGSSRTRPDLGGLGNPDFGAGAGSCLLISGRCGGDQFQCIGGDCDAFKGKGASDFQCIGGDCEAFKGSGSSGSGDFSCISGDCEAFKGSGSSGSGDFSCISGDCEAFKGSGSSGAGGTERIGGFDCTSDGTCSDIGKGADTTERPFVEEPSTGEVFGSDPLPPDNGAGGGEGDTAFASVRLEKGR